MVKSSLVSKMRVGRGFRGTFDVGSLSTHKRTSEVFLDLDIAVEASAAPSRKEAAVLCEKPRSATNNLDCKPHSDMKTTRRPTSTLAVIDDSKHGITTTPAPVVSALPPCSFAAQRHSQRQRLRPLECERAPGAQAYHLNALLA